MDLWIIDPTTGVQEEVIDSYESVSWKRSLYAAGSVTVSMRVEDLSSSTLATGQFLWVQDEHVAHNEGHLYIIESITVDAAAQTPPVAVVGRDVGSSYFPHRIVLPPAGLAHLSFSGPAESALHYYVDQCLGPSASAARRLPGLVMGANLARGSALDLAGRYQTLEEWMQAIGEASGMGWEITWDPDTKAFTFAAIVGTDRTATVFVDPEFETADQIKWLQSIVDTKNVAVVGGQGDLELRTIVTTWDGSEPTGLNRREVFVDARDTDDSGVLTQRGLDVIAAVASTDSFQVQVSPHGSFQYPDDFDLGDSVTVRSLAYGLQASAQIISVTQKAQSSGGGGLETTIEAGRVWPTLLRRVRQETARPAATGRA